MWGVADRAIFRGSHLRGAALRSALAFVPAAIWAAVLLWVGGSSDLPATPAVPHLDKVMHFGAYGVLGALLGFGWEVTDRQVPWPWLLALALLVGAADEYRQFFIEQRSGEFADWVADALGVSAGFLLAVRLTGQQRERRNDE
ncbi:hypothetical protein BH23GEM9_BH23GEM9_17880 [soil metagenome]